MSDERTLREITLSLGNAYLRWKSGEEDKEAERKAFFAAATKEAAKGTLAQKTVRVADEEVETEEDARAWVAKYYPTWRVVDFDYDDDEEVLVALLEENPEYVERVFVNPDDKRVYTKNVSLGTPVLDDDQLRADDPDLWERITEEPPPPPRRLLSSDKIDPDDLAAMEKYMRPGRPSAKLLAPRKAKDEELKGLNADEQS